MSSISGNSFIYAIARFYFIESVKLNLASTDYSMRQINKLGSRKSVQLEIV